MSKEGMRNQTKIKKSEEEIWSKVPSFVIVVFYSVVIYDACKPQFINLSDSLIFIMYRIYKLEVIKTLLYFCYFVRRWPFNFNGSKLIVENPAQKIFPVWINLCYVKMAKLPSFVFKSFTFLSFTEFPCLLSGVQNKLVHCQVSEQGQIGLLQ